MTLADSTPTAPHRGSSIAVLILLIIIGFGAGAVASSYYAIGLKAPPENASSAMHDAPVAGWCCPETGSSCAQAEDARVCLQGGGRLFTPDQTRCNTVCAYFATHTPPQQ